MRRIAALVAVTLMAACSGELNGSGQGAKGGAGGAAGDMWPPPGLPSDVAALCNAPDGNELTFQDRADAQVHLIGRWILCRPPGLTWATEQADQGGIELGADMSWHILRWVDGALTRADGFQAMGTYRFNAPQDLDFGPATNAMLFFGLDYSFVTATLLDSSPRMRWDNASIYIREANTN
jgi:hypothetical protein